MRARELQVIGISRSDRGHGAYGGVLAISSLLVASGSLVFATLHTDPTLSQQRQSVGNLQVSEREMDSLIVS